MRRFALTIVFVFAVALVGSILLAVLAFKMTEAVTNLP